jgi:hypothetical protein
MDFNIVSIDGEFVSIEYEGKTYSFDGSKFNHNFTRVVQLFSEAKDRGDISKVELKGDDVIKITFSYPYNNGGFNGGATLPFKLD